ncbi:MAG: methylenetetrahydrofolate--tRNA-(uracil(54)-C(5))-methyltransferase (FADH(2)-oxidizing) TrmFO, partial [Deltaproteobacteria bacterium]|nr:methylenetetrahydrofolate--tRNA-(uracil(54)-C(5))-methyltransferase (FADH(2)-oxidizing) TrmFO [Deltaproteobacteria bacterium]
MSETRRRVRIIGGGLAGCEAAWQLATAGFDVSLHEQKPHRRTPAQTSDRLAELVCSNSFRSANVDNAVGLLKEEMRRAGSFLMACAEVAKVPAGDALAVDRVVFADVVETRLRAHPRIALLAGEVTALPDDDVPTIVATGPLTADALAQDLARLCGRDRLAFYDAIAPIIDAESITLEDEDPDGGAYFKSRWNKGNSADYLNCPMTEEQYARFYDALRAADVAVAHEFEQLHYFDGCLPLEVMAERGRDTLRFGPFKPVGLYHPVTNRRSHAVLQLRKEDIHGTSYNLVGCQTRLKQGAQREVFSLVPALREVRFLRYGAIHRNTYVDAPVVLDERGALKARPTVWLAGQVTGVEGYVESTASGLTVALVVADALGGHGLDVPPHTTGLGGLWRHCRGVLRAAGHDDYAPSNVTWSMMPPVDPVTPLGKKKKASKAERKHAASERALVAFDGWLAERRAAGRFVGTPVVTAVTTAETTAETAAP